jgi:hypothetical protein
MSEGDQTINGIKSFANNIIGNLTGNAASATVLETPRLINSISFNGSVDINIPHNNLIDTQGGNATERYHLTEDEHIEATQYADGTKNGLLTKEDFDTFNNKVEEAPEDGKNYTRKDGTWEALTFIDGGGVNV